MMMYSKFKELKARYAIAATLKVAKVAEDRIAEILDYVFSKFEGYEKVAKSVNADKFIKLYNQHKDELCWMVGENEGSLLEPDFNVDETQVIVVFESKGKRDLVIVAVYEPNSEEYLDYFLQYEMKDDYEW